MNERNDNPGFQVRDGNAPQRVLDYQTKPFGRAAMGRMYLPLKFSSSGRLHPVFPSIAWSRKRGADRRIVGEHVKIVDCGCSHGHAGAPLGALENAFQSWFVVSRIPFGVKANSFSQATICSISVIAPSWTLRRNPKMIGLLFSSMIAWVTVPQVSVSMALRFRSTFPAFSQSPLPIAVSMPFSVNRTLGSSAKLDSSMAGTSASLMGGDRFLQ